MKISRDFATPLTIGLFGLMAVTGGLMFFHLDSGFNKLAHEWLGWLMITAVVLHSIVNWSGFKRYFLSSTSGRAIIALSVVVLGASFITLPGGAKGGPPQMAALRAVTRAPVTALAPLAGKPADQIVKDLAGIGIVLPDQNASLDSVTKGNRELQGKAIAMLFGTREVK